MKGKHVVGSPNIFIGSVGSSNSSGVSRGWGSCGASDSVSDSVDVTSFNESVSVATICSICGAVGECVHNV
jgi:hypothetical protein